MSALQHDLPGARVLDLFAGSGALGLEALSRGAASVTFVEKAAGPLKALQANVAKLGATAEVEIVKGDALKYVEALPADSFDIVLADPPYDTPAARQLVDAFARTPFSALLCVEHRTRDRLAVPQAARMRSYGDTTITFIPAEHA